MKINNLDTNLRDWSELGWFPTKIYIRKCHPLYDIQIGLLMTDKRHNDLSFRNQKYQFVCLSFRNQKYQFVLYVNSDLPPSQGGKYVGFGSAPNPPLNKEDSWASWSDSLSTVSIKYYANALHQRSSF